MKVGGGIVRKPMLSELVLMTAGRDIVALSGGR